MTELCNAINETLKRLNKVKNYEHVYISGGNYILNLGISPKRNEQTRKEYIGSIKDSTLEEVITNAGFDVNKVMTCEFYAMSCDTQAMMKPNNFLKLLFNRVVIEIAGVIPSPAVKNYMLSGIGVGIEDVLINGERYTPSIAPKTFIDYLNPKLIKIGAGTISGEAAKFQAHFFNPRRYVIGNINVGKMVAIGAGVRLMPGTDIRDSAIIGVDSTVSGYVPEGAHVAPNSYYKCFSNEDLESNVKKGILLLM